MSNTSPTSTITPPAVGQGSAAAWMLAGLILFVMAVALRLEGRVWWCEQGDWWPWIGDVWTPHCSQHLVDPYSITHMSHGLIFYWALFPLRGKLSLGWRFCMAVALAAGWEVLENSPLIIDRYRAETMSLDYMGDSVINSLGDVLCCAAGFFVARAIGLVWTAALFLTTEFGLLFLIRDNLTLNVLMLVSPIGAIKTWQSEGHTPPTAQVQPSAAAAPLVGEAAASSSTSDWLAKGAIDQNRFAPQPDHGWQGSADEATWWWQIEFAEPRQIGAILQIVGNDELLLKNAPSQYVWQASLDGQAWSDLPETAVENERRAFRIHRLKSPAKARFLRIAISAAFGDAPAIREVEVYADPAARINFPAWVLPVSTEEKRDLPFAGPDFVKLVHQCEGWQHAPAQHVWLDDFNPCFVALEPQPVAAFLSGNLAEWCQRTREPWRGTQQILEQGALPIWASCGGAQGLAILTETGVDRPWDCPRCRDPNNAKTPIYTHIGHTGPSACGVYTANIHERGPTFVKQNASDPAFAGLPVEFETMESHCGQIEYVPTGWTLVVTQGKNGKTRTQCMRRDDRPIYAAQFHIEMQGTPASSRQIMANFLRLASDWGGYNESGQNLPLPEPISSPGLAK